jgi:hypothetical protein
MDVDNVNRGKKKDKSKVTYYNYGKTGYYKNEYRTEKRDWILVSENKIKSINITRGMYNIVPELKPVRLKSSSSKLVKETRVMIKDEARKYDRNVKQSVGRL